MLGRNVHGLCYVDVELGFICKPHNYSRLADAMGRVEDKVLVGPAMDPNKDTSTPPNAPAGNSTFSGPSLEAQSLPEEW